MFTAPRNKFLTCILVFTLTFAFTPLFGALCYNCPKDATCASANTCAWPAPFTPTNAGCTGTDIRKQSNAFHCTKPKTGGMCKQCYQLSAGSQDYETPPNIGSDYYCTLTYSCVFSIFTGSGGGCGPGAQVVPIPDAVQHTTVCF
jgi:hypothetical protein